MYFIIPALSYFGRRLIIYNKMHFLIKFVWYHPIDFTKCKIKKEDERDIEFVCKFLGWTCMLYCLQDTLFCIDIISSLNNRALTPENVMLQMKYRYDREIDRCQRYFYFKRTIYMIIICIYHSICTRNY